MRRVSLLVGIWGTLGWIGYSQQSACDPDLAKLVNTRSGALWAADGPL